MSAQQIDSKLHISTGPSAPASTSPAKEEPSQQQNISPISSLQARRKEFNAAILQANHEVSLSIKNEPLTLLYKTAIEAINKELETDLGENSIEKGYQQGLDVSPEATAGRILSFSTGLFSLYQQQHPELSEQEQVEQFVDIIGGGIDTGFSEARDILNGLCVLKGEIAENIEKTYQLVQEGLLAFREQFSSS